MKKTVSLFLCLLSISFCLLSCASKAPYTILEIGGYDHISNANHSDEYRLEAKEYTEFKLSSEKTVLFNDATYDVSYDCTKKGYLYNSALEHYSKQDGLDFVEFGINKKTGRIDWYSWLEIGYPQTNELTEKSREECLSIARDYLASYIEDIDAYELTDERYREIPEYGAIYALEYARMIDGVRTADCARINITIYGTVVMHRFESFGEMKNATLPSQEKMEAIQSDIDKKLNSIYASVTDNYTVSYKLNNVIFERLADGKYALEYHYNVQLCGFGEDAKPIWETTRLIVILADS